MTDTNSIVKGFESATFILPEQEHPDSKLLYYDSTLGQEEKALGAGGLVRMICGRGISHCEVVEHEEHLMRASELEFLSLSWHRHFVLVLMPYAHIVSQYLVQLYCQAKAL